MFSVILLVILLFVFVIYYIFPRILVCGDSMFPTYYDEEILWGIRIFKKKNLKVGDVVVVRVSIPNNEGHEVVIKRIADIRDKEIYILGDNPDVSYDSREYGYLPIKFVLAKILDQRSKGETR